jgi:hypothetical protein
MLTSHRRDLAQPPTDTRVVSLLAAAAAPSEPGPVPGETEAMAAFRATTETAVSWRSRMLSLPPLKTMAAAALGTGLLLSGGVAAAATGSLPGAAQDTASDMLAKVGVTVPGANEHSAGHADERGKSETARTPDEVSDSQGTSGASEQSEQPDASSHGREVSELATTTDATGVDKGAEISALASDGKSRAGQQTDHKPGTTGDDAATDTHAGQARPDNAGGTQPSVETRHSDGSDTADDASGGHSTAGSTNRP